MEGLTIGCEQQPGTALLLDVKGNLSSAEGGTVSIVEVGGTPNAWDASSQPYPTPLPERFRYAFPQVWGGELTGCRWHGGADIEDCAASDPNLPIWEGSSCHWMECSGSDIQCPPDDVQQCPGYNGTNDFPCGFVPDTGPNWVSYWTHKCYPVSTPSPGSQISLKCRITENDDTFECIFWHEGMTIPPFIPFTCQVGNCVYGDPIFPEPPHSIPKHKYNLAQTKVIFLIFCILSMALFFAHVLIDRWQLQQGRIQYQKVLARMESTENLSSPISPTRARMSGEAPLWSPIPGASDEGGGNATLSWDGISCTVASLRRNINVLKEISGRVGGGKGAPTGVCALLGPSGAGKTTLLNILAGRANAGHISGTVELDGRALRPSERRAAAGYVSQVDVLPGTSTVWEHLVFHARLRLSRNATQQDFEARAWEVLATLGLAKVASSLIGDEFTRGISGGEKRRVSIASELLVHPRVMFLDEPTTGLDSSNAASVVDILAGLAAAGTVVVMSIHQPTVGMMRAMDSLVLLSLQGRMVYSGPTADSVGHFEALGYTPAKGSSMIDHMLDALIHAGREESEDLVGAFQYSGARTLESAEAGVRGQGLAGGISGAFSLANLRKEAFAVRLLLQRSGKKTFRNPLVIFLTFLASGLVSAGLGLTFHGAGRDTNGIQNRFGCLFFILWYLSMMTVGSLPVWHDDYLVFMRERASKVYSTTSHFVAVVLYDIVMLRLIPPAFFGAVYAFIGLHEGHAGRFIVTLILANVAATVMTLMIGLVSSKVSTANVAGTVVMLLNSLFGGYLLSGRELSPALALVAQVFPGHHAYAMLVANEFHATSGWRFTGEVNGREVGVDVTGDDILDTFGFGGAAWGAGLRALLLIIAACLALTHALLKHRWSSEL
jgi:ATP-binding cassette subfamily G (WHITE) protein 2